MITKADVKGIFPPLVTPMYEDEEINFEQFKSELDFMMGLPITGMVIGAVPAKATL